MTGTKGEASTTSTTKLMSTSTTGTAGAPGTDGAAVTRHTTSRARPTLIPGPLAAQEAGVAPATIRKWVQLGHLAAAGKAGRAQLFRLEDVFAAERAARGQARRTR